jgi:hypothetical protein
MGGNNIGLNIKGKFQNKNGLLPRVFNLSYIIFPAEMIKCRQFIEQCRANNN